MLISTKFFLPALPQAHLPRHALVERLRVGGLRRLTVITAPAGYGKSTLIGELLPALSRPYGCLTLETGDSEPARFWTHVGHALGKIFAGLGAEATDALRSSRVPPIEGVLASWLNELAEREDFGILALDDFHCVDDEAIHRDLDYFIERMPPTLRLIIAGRRRPPLRLARWRARGDLHELGERDLQFGVEEGGTYLQRRLGDVLSDAQRRQLIDRSEGWPAALQLAATTLEHRSDPAADWVAEFRGSQQQIAEFLAEEVLAGLASPLQRTAMQLAVVGAFNAALCSAVTGTRDPQAMLEELEDSHLPLVRLDREGRWLRFQHLFGEFLQRRFDRLDPERVREVHHRASRWFEEAGDLDRAFAHACAAEEIERAMLLLSRAAGAAVERGESAAVIRAVEKIGRPLEALPPELLIHLASALYVANSTDRCRDALAVLERSRDKGLLDARQEALTRLMQGTLARSRDGDLRGAVAAFEAGLQPLPEEDLATRGRVAFQLGIAQLYAFELDAAEETFTRCLRMTPTASLFEFGCLGQLASLEIVRGRLYRAEALCQRGLERDPSLVSLPAPGLSLIYRNLGMIQLERGDWAAAERDLNEALHHGRLTGFDEMVAFGHLWIAELGRALGDSDRRDRAMAEVDRLITRGSLTPMHVGWHRALRLHRSLDEGDRAGGLRLARRWPPPPGPAVTPPTMFDQAWRLARIRALAVAGEVATARHELGDQLAAARQGGRVGTEIEILAWRAWLDELTGVRDGSESLVQALNLAREEAFLCPFLAVPRTEIRRLVDRVLAQEAVPGGARDLASKLRRELRQGLSQRDGAKSNPSLTAKEQQVLALLAEGRSNAQIAAQLGVAASTVKTHLKHIFAKLGVRRRTQAVARARDAGLV